MISRSVVLAGLLPSKNISLPNGMGFRWFEEGFQFPTFGSNRKRATARGLLWPRTRHRSLSEKRSGGKSPRRTLHLCPRKSCFETPARAGSA